MDMKEVESSLNETLSTREVRVNLFLLLNVLIKFQLTLTFEQFNLFVYGAIAVRALDQAAGTSR